MFQSDLFDGKHVLVTGGGTGLGFAMAQRLADLGARLTLWGRRQAVLERAADAIAGRSGRPVQVHSVDIRDPAAIAAAVDRTVADAPLDGLINNAAANFIAPTESLSPNGFNAIAQTVFHGTFHVTQCCAKHWLTAGRPASVVSILTTWVRTGSPFVVPSAMSKAALAAMTRSLALEWGPRGLRFNAIAPGPFPTKGAWARLMPGADEQAEAKAKAAIPMRRYGRHEELANLAAFLLSEQVGYLNGEIIAIDGGQHLNNAGAFTQLWDVTPEQWQQMREAIRAADKAETSDQ
ncbi:MAG: SDR family oxidoreductase [Rhodothalassiaceae bacterium]